MASREEELEKLFQVLRAFAQFGSTIVDEVCRGLRRIGEALDQVQPLFEQPGKASRSHEERTEGPDAGVSQDGPTEGEERP